jgi:uncharacterized membrane protein YvlD (DUF360 family)
MKRILRLFVIETAGLFIASRIATGMVFADELEGLLVTGAALTLASHLIKPLINVLLLPITLATLGLLKFLGGAITLFIVDTALPQFEIVGFHFPGFTSSYFSLPPINYSHRVGGYLAFAFIISAISTLIHWVRK